MEFNNLKKRTSMGLLKLAINKINAKLEKMSEEEREQYMNDVIKKLEGSENVR